VPTYQVGDQSRYRKLFEEALEKYSAELGTNRVVPGMRPPAEPQQRLCHMAQRRCSYRPLRLRGGRSSHPAWGATRDSAHIVLGHCNQKNRQHRYEREAAAEGWANQRMRELGVPVPRKTRQLGKSYVAWTKSWGDNVAAGRRRSE
jgi:hypothetical protein